MKRRKPYDIVADALATLEARMVELRGALDSSGKWIDHVARDTRPDFAIEKATKLINEALDDVIRANHNGSTAPPLDRPYKGLVTTMTYREYLYRRGISRLEDAGGQERDTNWGL